MKTDLPVFVGFSPRGPINEAREIKRWGQFIVIIKGSQSFLNSLFNLLKILRPFPKIEGYEPFPPV
jgi:hypothetical protein